VAKPFTRLCFFNFIKFQNQLNQKHFPKETHFFALVLLLLLGKNQYSNFEGIVGFLRA